MLQSRVGITHGEEETEIMGGVRRWAMGGTLHPIKGFFAGRLVQTKRLFLGEPYLSEASPADILTVIG